MSGSLEAVYERVAGGVAAESGRELLAACRDLAASPSAVTLDGGRDLAFAEAGDPDGRPLVVLHGTPGSRLSAALFGEVARERGLRVVAPDRPGVGASDPAPGRGLADWPADLAGLLDALGVDAAPVLGVGGGGPHALATATLRPELVTRVGVLSGVGPPGALGASDRLPYLLARYLPPAARYRLRRAGQRARSDPEAYLRGRADDAASVDRELWLGPVGRATVLARLEGERHHGVDAFVEELAAFARAWGFDPGDVDAPVRLWHGSADRVVPAAMGRALADRIPGAETAFYPGLGHLSTLTRNEAEVVDWLAGG